jgi:hypothetical protein
LDQAHRGHTGGGRYDEPHRDIKSVSPLTREAGVARGCLPSVVRFPENADRRSMACDHAAATFPLTHSGINSMAPVRALPVAALLALTCAGWRRFVD